MVVWEVRVAGTGLVVYGVYIPTFYNNADENMFFNAIYSMLSIAEIVGEGRELYLYCNRILTKEEKVFLVGLLIKIPSSYSFIFFLKQSR